MFSTIISALVNIVINFVGIKKIGIMGAAIGTVVAFLILAYVKMFDVKRYVGFEIRPAFYINTAIVIVFATLVTIGMDGMAAWAITLICILAFIVINRNDFLAFKVMFRKYADRRK